MKTCSSCGAQLPDESKFCLKCGSPVPQQIVCSHCGAKVPSGFSYCGVCGKKIAGESVPQRTEAPKQKPIVNQIPQKNVPHKRKKNNKPLYALAIAVVFGILMLVVVGAIYYNNSVEKREARLAREKFVADSLEAARQDSLVQIEKREKEKQEAIAAQKKKMPTVNQVMNIWKKIFEIQSNNGGYDYDKFVTTRNMKPLAINISGLELLLCNVGKSYEYSEPEGGYVYFDVPVICYGIYSKVKDVKYKYTSPSVKFIATSEHACGFYWSQDDYNTSFHVSFNNEEDAIAFFNQIKYINVIDGNTHKLVKGYEKYRFELYSNKPEYENGWYTIRLGIEP